MPTSSRVDVRALSYIRVARGVRVAHGLRRVAPLDAVVPRAFRGRLRPASRRAATARPLFASRRPRARPRPPRASPRLFGARRPLVPSPPPAPRARPGPGDRIHGLGPSILLAAYVTQPATWARLVAPRARARAARCAPRITVRPPRTRRPTRPHPLPASPVVVLELGAGTGAAGLAVAATGLPRRRHDRPPRNPPSPPPQRAANARTRRAGPSPRPSRSRCARSDQGEEGDVDALPAPCRDADVVLGADLAYTTDARVIDALVEPSTGSSRPTASPCSPAASSTARRRWRDSARAEARGFDEGRGEGELGEGSGGGGGGRRVQGRGAEEATREAGGGRRGEAGVELSADERGSLPWGRLQETASFASQRSSVRFSRGQ